MQDVHQKRPLIELQAKLLAEFTNLLVGADVSKLDAYIVLRSVKAICIDDTDEGLLCIEVERVETAAYDGCRARAPTLDLSKYSTLLEIVD